MGLYWFDALYFKKGCRRRLGKNKDLSAESAITRGKLRAAYRKAKDLNITRVSIKGNKLFVNSDSYSADKLPDFLLPSKDNSNQNTSSSPE